MSCAKFGYKTCVIFLSLLQFCISIIIMIAGAYAFAEFNDIKEFSKGYMAPASILIACGVFLLILAVLGICGACKENKWILAIFFIFSGALFLLEFIGACVALGMRKTFEASVNGEFVYFMNQTSSSNVYKKEVDWIQYHWGCCGAHNVTDYVKNNLSVPTSCCSNIDFGNSTETNCTVNIVQKHNVSGCINVLHTKFFGNLNLIAGVGMAFAFVQIAALASVLFLICRKERHYEVF